jgi:hypothetical protein
MAKYLANVNIPGYLPMDDDSPGAAPEREMSGRAEMPEHRRRDLRC